MSQENEKCVKCDASVPDEYLSVNPPDEKWIECIHSGWYCPEHSPNSPCDDEECYGCNPMSPEEVKFRLDTLLL
jgi:hypothetical protein